MATIVIEPITAKSTGGHAVVINGISPMDHDCLAGSITTPTGGTSPARWNLNGTMRGGSAALNLALSADDELVELVALAKQLGAKP